MHTVYNDKKSMSRCLSIFVHFSYNFYFCKNYKYKIQLHYEKVSYANIYKY